MSAATSVAPAESNNGLLNFIERAARDPEFDVAKFGELLRMQRDIVTEQERREFNRAMSAAQAEMLPVIRDATNAHIGSKYARLETIDREMRPVYTQHGFSVRYGSAPSPREGWLRIICTVSHVGGYSETNYLDAPPDASGQQGRSNKTPVQAVGSSVTYLRRYLLTMVFNIVLANDDDDGESARQQSTSSLREQVNREVPVGNAAFTAAPPSRSWSQWADSLELALHGSRPVDEVARVLARAEVQEIHRRSLEGSASPAKQRIRNAVADAELRVAERPPPEEPKADTQSEFPDWVGLDDAEATPAEGRR